MANTFPIVTEVTKLQLDALIAANALEQGLQYKVTDKEWLILATSNNAYMFMSNIPFSTVIGFLTQTGTDAPIIEFLQKEIEVTSQYVNVGDYYLKIPYTNNKILSIIYTNVGYPMTIEILYQNDGEYFNILTKLSGFPTDGILFNTPFEIRQYFV